MALLDYEKNIEIYQLVKKAIYDYCFREGSNHNTFLAKNIGPQTGMSTRMLGGKIMPKLIEQGLIKIYSRGNHATRYIIEREKWSKMSF